ncbi:hypothetical protein KC725_06040 [Candidatus Peregrinibacteria bacterium]|nr:hypothetical protein [Candidatus Peregrinibacteria bacterium]MCB9144135.1 hypothetical protein [Anaerolineales bacterium]
MNRLVVPLIGWLAFGLTACASTPSTPPISYSPTPDPIQAYVDANNSEATAVAAISTADYHKYQLNSTNFP